MAAQRLWMKQLRNILRLRHELGLTHRKIACSTGVGLGTPERAFSLAAIRTRVAGMDVYVGIRAACVGSYREASPCSAREAG